MYIKFNSKKCPMCGNFGTNLNKELFECSKCRLEYDEYIYYGEPELHDSNQWN